MGIIGGVGKVANAAFPGNGVSSVIQKILYPGEAAKTDVAHNVLLDAENSPNAAISNIQKAQASGIEGSPGELLGGSLGNKSLVRGAEGKIALAEENKGPLAKYLVGRTNSAKQDILENIDNMNTPESMALHDGLRAKANSQYIGPNNELLDAPPASTNYVPQVIKDNSVLNKELGNVVDNPAYAGKALNSIDQLSEVKSSLGDKLNSDMPNSFGVRAAPLDKGKRDELLYSQNKIKEVLDQSPEYKQATDLWANKMNQEELNKLISRSSIQKGTGSEASVTFDQVYDNLLKNEIKGNIFKDYTVKAGADPELVDKLVATSNALKDSPLWKVYKGTPDAGVDSTAKGRVVGMIQEFANSTILKRYNNALADLAIGGVDKWGPQLTSVLKATGTKQQLGFMELLNNVAKRGAVATASTAVAQPLSSAYGL
jgi:hypothetical protein